MLYWEELLKYIIDLDKNPKNNQKIMFLKSMLFLGDKICVMYVKKNFKMIEILLQIDSTQFL